MSGNSQIIFFAAAALFVALQTFLGWRRGVVRQLMAVVALLAAYLVGWFGGKWAVPVVRSTGLPDAICAVLGGAGLGLATFACITVLGDILFKKTAQQGVFAVRWVYGAGGALIGLVFGLFAVWVAVVGIRCIGTIAETELAVAEKGGIAPPGRTVVSLARMKDSLDHGAAGAFIAKVDPLPDETYDILAKITRVASSAESAQRFLNYPGAKEITKSPRIIALRDDPGIQKAVGSRDFYSLLTNEKIVAAANDPEVARLVRQFEFLKALDYAERK
jgi:uncharacterized membrane protein required for colicin V production